MERGVTVAEARHRYVAEAQARLQRELTAAHGWAHGWLPLRRQLRVSVTISPTANWGAGIVLPCHAWRTETGVTNMAGCQQQASSLVKASMKTSQVHALPLQMPLFCPAQLLADGAHHNPTKGTVPIWCPGYAHSSAAYKQAGALSSQQDIRSSAPSHARL